MFKNLKAEMARHSITMDKLSENLNLPRASVYNRLSGKTEFKVSEVQIILSMFPSLSYEYIFEKSE